MRACLILILTLVAGCTRAPLLEPAPSAPWRQVSVGEGHSCAITEDGAAYCWTDDPWSELPYDTAAERRVPVRVPGLGPVREVAVGSDSFCATEVAGETRCWGLNSLGQLGTGAFTDQEPLPARMAGGLALRGVDLAEHHGCALDPEGRAWCWGLDRAGVEPASLRPCPGHPDIRCAPAPGPVESRLRFASLSTSAYHACAISEGGQAYCWGMNGEGAFGDGTDADSRVPVAAAGGRRLAAVAAGGMFTCGVATTGQAYCWGNHNDGQLGSPRRAEHDDARCDYGPCSLVPVAVAGGHRFAALAAGGDHACAISTRQRLYCWGSNFAQQLGSARAGRERCGYYDHVPCSRRPVPVLAHLRFRALAAGGDRTCAVTVAGNAFCWGGARPSIGPGHPPVDGAPVRIQPPD